MKKTIIYRFIITVSLIVSTICLGISSDIFDHDYKKLDIFLQNYVNVDGEVSSVRYKEIRNNKSDLPLVLNSISKLSQKEYNDFSNNQKLAFLINAYNVFTIKLIVDNYPVKSIKDIGSFFTSPWKKKIFNMLDRKVSLDEIEHDIIRKKFSEPRIHFALVCASKSCPRLLNRAYTGKQLSKQLEISTTSFLKNNKFNYYDEKKNTLYLSSIFKWYGDDFNKNGHKLNTFLEKYLKNNDVKKADVKIKYLDYDWGLNESK